MHTVIFLETKATGQVEVGTIELGGDGKPVVQPEVASLAEWLFQDVDQNHPAAVIAAMQKAPSVFDGGYLRAAYENR